MILFRFYNGFVPSISDITDPYSVQEGIGRESYLRPFALSLMAFVCVKRNPLKFIEPNHWGLAVMVGVAAVLAAVTGYRSALIALGFYAIVAMWMWMRGAGVIICTVFALLFMLVVPSIQSFVPLPDQVQRSLSFLPGDWDDRIARSGEQSTEWRVEMWEAIIEGDMIENWWIGDGFGFPRAEFEYYSFLQRTGQIRSDQLAEYYLITGDLHSGPLSAAKFSGITGGLLYIILALMVFWNYLKSWRKLEPYPEFTDLRQVVGFYCILSSYIPFKFIFIAGFYDREIPTLIVSAGLCRLFSRLSNQEITSAQADEVNQASEEGGLSPA
jgi:hypothetical protein